MKASKADLKQKKLVSEDEGIAAKPVNTDPFAWIEVKAVQRVRAPVVP